MGILCRVTRVAVLACAAALFGGAAVSAAEPFVQAPACRPEAAAIRPAAAQTVQSSYGGAGITVHRVAAQVRRNDKADMTFATSATRDGALQVEGRGGDLLIRKTVRHDGSFTLVLEAPRDRVTIEFANQSVSVARGKTTIALADPQNAENDLARAQRLLSNSPAVRLSRLAAAAVENSEDDSPESSAVLLSDALVGVLTGDVGAPARVARHLSRHVRAGIRKAAMNCYYNYETEVYGAWVDYGDCLDSISVWNPIRWLCSLRYLVMAESSWFEFLSCVGFSGFIQ